MKKFIKNLILKIGSIFKIKNVLVFESHADYSESSRAFSEYLVKNKYNEKYKIYWFVNDASKYKKLECKNVKFLTMWHNTTKKTLWQWVKYFWIAKNAKYLISSNRTLNRVNKMTKTVYVNHGIAIKNIKNKQVTPIDVDIRIDSSEFCAELMMDQQRLKRSQIVVLGNPRNDIIFTKTNIEEKMKELMSFNKRILWLPTFRKHAFSDRNDSSFEFPLGIPIIYNEENLNKLNDYLNERNIALILKPHPAQDLSIFKINSLSNIIIISNQDLVKKNVELSEFFKITDALLTDYSSVYIDYLLTQKPVGFTIDDFDQYHQGFSIENILDYMPGEKIKDYDDLKLFIDNLSENIDNYKKEREKVNKIFNEFNDNKSCERLAKYLDL